MTGCSAYVAAMIRSVSSALVLVLATAPSPAAALDHALAEDRLSALINDVRAAEALPMLQPRQDLATIARQRSQDMAMNSYFGHALRDGRFFDDLLSAAGLDYSLGGEIIARNNRPEASSVQVAFNGWLNSPAHRDIILDRRYNEIGVGTWSSPGGMHYFTALLLEHD